MKIKFNDWKRASRELDLSGSIVQMNGKTEIVTVKNLKNSRITAKKKP